MLKTDKNEYLTSFTNLIENYNLLFRCSKLVEYAHSRKNIRLETAKQSLVKTHFCLSNRTNPPKKNERKEIKKESINLSETQKIYEKHTKKLTIFSMADGV